MYKLVIQDDEGKTTVVPLIRDELTIGRKEGNTIRLTERNVSRRHARLSRQNGSITIEDLNSYNGIRVNGTRIQGACTINEADRVQIGDYLIEVKSEAKDQVATLNERTVPIERVDPSANTPVPDVVQPSDSAQVTSRMADGNGAAPAYTNQAPTEPVPAPVDEMSQTVPMQSALATAGNARLVVLSTNMAGHEFELDKPSMVIGRTEDNEVWVNHRSISRHHAKIVRENGRYSVVDLQSSNGVRVNGEEYGKVELRRGDVIDLGHVRMRFVEAGEDFVFGRDAQAIDIGSAGRSRAAVWVALLLLLSGAGVALFLIMNNGTSGDGAEGGDEIASAPSALPQQDTTAAVADSDAAPVQAIEQPTGDDAAKLSATLEEARNAINNEKWQDAERAAREALVLAPENQDAKALLEQAKAELGSQELYRQFAKAVRAKNYEQVAVLYRQMDPESVYRVKAQPDHDRLKGDFIKYRSNQGKKLADRSRCKEQRQLGRESGRAWPEAEAAVTSHSCKERTASTGGSTSSGGSTGGSTSNGGQTTGGTTTTSGGTTTAPPTGPDFTQLLDQAREAALAGHYGKALRYCEQALDKRPGDQQAIQTCAVASCKLKSASRAKRYLRKINSENRKHQMRQICLQAGVTDI